MAGHHQQQQEPPPASQHQVKSSCKGNQLSCPTNPLPKVFLFTRNQSCPTNPLPKVFLFARNQTCPTDPLSKVFLFARNQSRTFLQSSSKVKPLSINVMLFFDFESKSCKFAKEGSSVVNLSQPPFTKNHYFPIFWPWHRYYPGSTFHQAHKRTLSS